MGTIPNNPEAIGKLARKLGPGAIFCYEAGPCGYTIYRQLERLGFPVSLVFPGTGPFDLYQKLDSGRESSAP